MSDQLKSKFNVEGASAEERRVRHQQLCARWSNAAVEFMAGGYNVQAVACQREAAFHSFAARICVGDEG